MSKQIYPILGEQKLRLAYLEIFNGFKTMDSSVVYPGKTYKASLIQGINADAFLTMCNSLCEIITVKPHTVKDIRSIGGNDWQTYVRKVMISEIYMVSIWLAWCNSQLPKVVNADNYANFIQPRLTQGAASFLYLAGKQSDNDWLGADNDRVNVDYQISLAPGYIAGTLCEKAGLENSFLPVIDQNGVVAWDPCYKYVLERIYENHPDFAYKHWDVSNKSRVDLPIGDCLIGNYEDPNVFSTYILDCSRMITKSEMAYGLLFAVNPDLVRNPDWWHVEGNPIYKKYTGKVPNMNQFRSYFLKLYTNISDGSGRTSFSDGLHPVANVIDSSTGGGNNIGYGVPPSNPVTGAPKPNRPKGKNFKHIPPISDEKFSFSNTFSTLLKDDNLDNFKTFLDNVSKANDIVMKHDINPGNIVDLASMYTTALSNGLGGIPKIPNRIMNVKRI